MAGFKVKRQQLRANSSRLPASDCRPNDAIRPQDAWLSLRTNTCHSGQCPAVATHTAMINITHNG